MASETEHNPHEKHAQRRVNQAIWDKLYDSGLVLAYPSEVFVRLYHRHARIWGGERPRFLDHGAGSGNNSEFLVRQGHDVIATDISEAALRSIRARFRHANLPLVETVLIKPEQPLATQLPEYEAVLAWDSLCYNTEEGSREDLAALIAGLPRNGVMFVNMPTRNHDFFRKAEQIGSATFIFDGENGAQEGAVMTSPASLDEFVSWCEGLNILASGIYGYRDHQVNTEFMFVVGRAS